MSYYGSNKPPPLPPRSPRPAVNVTPSSTGHPNWSYPPPPPGPPPQLSGYSDTQPPPIPPRPPGYEITTGPSSSNTQRPLSFAIPPPPPGPPSGVVIHSPSYADPPPQYNPQINIFRPNQSHGYSPVSPLNSGAQSPNGLTSFPPPPSGPPPQNTTSSDSHGQFSIPQYQPAAHGQAGTHGLPVQSSTNPSMAPYLQSPLLSPSLQVFSEVTPGLPSPTYTPLGETPDYQLSGNASDPSISSYLYEQPISYFQSPSSSSTFSPPPTMSLSTEALETKFQSLTVGSPPAISTQPPTSSCALQIQRSSPNYLPNITAAPEPEPQVSQLEYYIHELPAENKLREMRAEPSTEAFPPPPPAVTSCIDTPMSFATDWYWHPAAPEFWICSRCYVDHIHRTRFRASFQGERFDDGKLRVCRFSKPRMRDHLFQAALATGSLESALEWMCSRPQVPDCKGVEGVKGKAGIKWYRAKSDEIPGFVSCEACYEDRVLTNSFSANFEPTPPQPAGETWACDVAVPFIEKEYEARAKLNDWAGFVGEAKARISMKACPQRNKSLMYGSKWFVPKDGPEGLVLCTACYCDQVIHTGEEWKWEVAEGYTREYDKYVRCAMGIFSIKIAMARAHEMKDFPSFWTAVRKLAKEKFCEEDGIEDGVWYTLSSDPSNFGLCAGCYVAIAEPLGVARFFVRKRDAQPASTKWRCCFSVAHPRFRNFVPRLLEMYFVQDPTSFDKYVSVYASIPACPREQDEKNRHWYGWMDCTICPECYLEYARHRPLATKMDLNNALLENTTMCELYSPRMRALYAECGEASPPDPKPLLEYSVQRRYVWMETVPQMRMMLFRAKMALNQQRFLNATSSFYNNAGMLDEITYGRPSYTYGAAGVGYGYANMNLLQGAMYGQQAMQVGASAANPGATMLVGQLEQRWRAVE